MDIVKAKEAKKSLEIKILDLLKEFESKTKTSIEFIELESIAMHSVSNGSHLEFDSIKNVKIKVSL